MGCTLDHHPRQTESSQASGPNIGSVGVPDSLGHKREFTSATAGRLRSSSTLVHPTQLIMAWELVADSNCIVGIRHLLPLNRMDRAYRLTCRNAGPNAMTPSPRRQRKKSLEMRGKMLLRSAAGRVIFDVSPGNPKANELHSRREPCPAKGAIQCVCRRHWRRQRHRDRPLPHHRRPRHLTAHEPTTEGPTR